MVLTSILQGTSSVTLTYDDANRRSTLTLPNGVVVDYAYNDSSRVTGLTYTLGGTPLGNLGYGSIPLAGASRFPARGREPASRAHSPRRRTMRRIA